MNGEIDLGMKHGDMMPMPMEDMKNKVMYPHLNISGDKELDLPDSGVMEIEFRKVSESERKNEDGSETYDCCIEVRKILEVEEDEEPEPPARSGTEAEEALDKLAEVISKKKGSQ